MGLQASIDISYSEAIDIKLFLNILFNCDWDINDNSKINYLINDDFDWKTEDLTKRDLISKLLYERFSCNKMVGIALTLPDSTGGLFHFLPNKKEIMILLNINRKKVQNTNFTDFSFYIEKLKPVLKNNLLILNCSDVI